MTEKEDDKLGRFGEPISTRFRPHTDYLINLKSNELGKTRSDTVRFIVDSYFDKQIQDPELIFASLNDSKKRIQELENRLDLLMVVLLEQTKKFISLLPNRQAVSNEVARIEFENFMKTVFSEVRNGERGKIESMVLDIYQHTQGGKE